MMRTMRSSIGLFWVVLLGWYTACRAQEPTTDLDGCLAQDRDLRSQHLVWELRLDSLREAMDTLHSQENQAVLQILEQLQSTESLNQNRLFEPDSGLMSSPWLDQLRSMATTLNKGLRNTQQALGAAEVSGHLSRLLDGMSRQAAAADTMLEQLCRPGLALSPLERLENLVWVRSQLRQLLQDLGRLQAGSLRKPENPVSQELQLLYQSN